MAKKKGTNAFKQLITSLVMGANLCTLALLWLCVLSTYVPPSSFPYVGLFGLVFPFLVVANILFCLFWLLWQARYSLVSFFGLLVVGGFVMDYCPVSMESEVPDSALCVLSYNTGDIKDDEYSSLDSLVCALRPDIVCLQEYSQGTLGLQELNRLQDSLGYQMMKSGSRVILSQHPILGDSVVVSYPSHGKGNGTLSCWISYKGDSVLVSNNHLESNCLTVEDKTEYKRMILEHQKEQVKSEGRYLADKLRDASLCRGEQTDSVCRFIDEHKGTSIIFCGDMNDTPISYTYQRISDRLSSAFREKGTGVGISYNQRGFYVRIDHLFHTPDWECVKCYVDDRVSASDHNPLVVYLHKKQQ